jgi:uncharacterized protein with NRDE domain
VATPHNPARSTRETMCLIGLRWQPDDAERPLWVACNRDEFRVRPTAPAAWWPEGLLAGRDLASGGTWVGVTRSGRFAAVTNYRDPSALRPGASSRGALPVAFLVGDLGPRAYLDRVRARRDDYAPFNLIVGTSDELWWYGSRPDRLEAIAPGAHALSNADLDTPWPKARRLRGVMGSARADDEPLAALTDRAVAPDDQLPDTNVGLDAERALSAAFIDMPAVDYGTRSTTLVRLGPWGGRLVELTWPSGGRLDFAW